MADGIYYRDTRQPVIIADEASITLATTQKALWPYARTLLPANYWTVGKTVKLTAFGKITTGTTPNNFTFGIGYGSADAPTALSTGAAVAAKASQTNLSFRVDAYVTCRLVGSSGTLLAWGQWWLSTGLYNATTQETGLIPASALAATTVDTTVGTNSLVITMARSGSTGESTVTQSLIMEALN